MIQFPICVIQTIQSTNDKCEIVVSFDVDDNFAYYKFLHIFDYQISNHLAKKGVTTDRYTPGHTETKITEGGFRQTKIFIKLKTTNATSYYNREKAKIHHYELKVGDKVIPLVTTRGIFMDDSGANQRWTAKQILRTGALI